MKIRCAIIDDEFLARKLIKDYISDIPFIELVGDFNSPLKATELIHENKVDLLFLDIQMPGITGLEFLRSLENRPYIILTTAYKEYALESYEFGVTDYLLKPFSFEKLFKAVNKVRTEMENAQTEVPAGTGSVETNDENDGYLIIRADRKFYKINHDDLIYVEGQKAYVTFHSESNKKVTALASLKDLEEKLPSDKFIRIPNSFIVSIKKIQALEGNMLEIGNEKLPIGKSFKPVVNKVFGLNE